MSLPQGAESEHTGLPTFGADQLCVLLSACQWEQEVWPTRYGATSNPLQVIRR